MDPISNQENVDDLIFDIKKRMEEVNRKEHPDYSNTVYCDKHWGVKMVLATSWGTIEYGDTSVDANTILL